MPRLQNAKITECQDYRMPRLQNAKIVSFFFFYRTSIPGRDGCNAASLFHAASTDALDELITNRAIINQNYE